MGIMTLGETWFCSNSFTNNTNLPCSTHAQSHRSSLHGIDWSLVFLFHSLERDFLLDSLLPSIVIRWPFLLGTLTSFKSGCFVLMTF